MKPKSALFISATLTAFVLAILGGVVSNLNTAGDVSSVASPTPQVLVVDAPAQLDPTATQPAQVGPEQAAALAAEFMHQTSVYSVESTTFNSVNAYKVVFSSGDVVYVGLDGSILSTEKLQPTVIVNFDPTATPGKHKNSNNNGGGNSGGGHEHEPEDEDHD